MDTSKRSRPKVNSNPTTNNHLPRPHIQLPPAEARVIPSQPVTAKPSEPVLSPDQMLLNDIRESLSQLSYLQFRELCVTVSDGLVRLDGIVARYYWRQLAENAVINTPGVRDLNSNLVVSSPK